MRRESAGTRRSSRPSLDARGSVSTGSRRPSSFGIVAGSIGEEIVAEDGKKQKETKEAKPSGFNGAMVGHSRRKGGMWM